MTLIEKLPVDQRNLIVERLTMHKVRKIEKSTDDEITHLPLMALGDRMRGNPRRAYPINRFYQTCLREMGQIGTGLTKIDPVPTPGKAWLQIIDQRLKVLLEDPTFTHKEIAETITYFGGWKAMWKEFNAVQKMTARNRFIMAYKDIVKKGEK